MVGITDPPLEHPHNWRQATGTMVARNFVETSNNILYPRTDETNGGTGIIGMEFPLLNYLIYLVSLVFGYTHWYGRLINLVVSSIGIYYFYQIVRRYIHQPAALPATIIMLASLWFSFSRKTMPDTFSLALCIISLYYGLVYLFEGRISKLLLFALFLCLGGLSKIPSLILPIFCCISLLDPAISMRRKIYLCIAGTITMAPILWWYFYWCPHLSATYGSWFNAGKSLSAGLKDIAADWDGVFSRFYFNALRYIGFAVFIIGIVLAIIKREKKVLVVFLVSLPLVALYILKSGFFFLEHDYYILPYVPIMCIMAGYAISVIPNQKLQVLLLLAIVIEGIGDQQHDFFFPKKEWYRTTIEQAAKDIKKDELVAVSDGPNPQMLYLSHRKGWVLKDYEVYDTSYLHALALKGCRYVIVDRNRLQEALPYEIAYEDSNFRTYRLPMP